MAIVTAIATSYKKELLEGLHDHNVAGNVFKLALYLSAATLGAATTVYSATNESSGTGYSAGGGTLTNVDPTNSSTSGITDYADLTFSTATVTARGCSIYNSTNGNRVVQIHDFGSDKSSSAADFVIQFPTADSVTAIIRLA